MSSRVRRPESAYTKLARQLRLDLMQRKYSGGARLPTEAELSARYGLSRQTVRRAFQELVTEGLVRRVPGQGTFPIGDDQYLRQVGSIEDLMSLAQDTTLEILEPLQPFSNSDFAARLEVENDALHALTFRRHHGNHTLCVATAILPNDVAELISDEPSLSRAGKASDDRTIVGLIDKRLPVPITEAEQVISAVAARPDIALMLECAVGEPLLKADRIYLDANGKPVEITVTHFLPERYSYRVRLRRTGR